MPLGGAFMRYLSVEILALHLDNVKHSVENIFSLPRAIAIPRRGIRVGDKNIILKISARAAEFRANTFQFSRPGVFSRTEIAQRSAPKARLQGVPKK